MLEAIAFAIYACGYYPRCALDTVDSGHNRLTKIIDLINLCDFSLHDISRTELNSHQLPRLNMPFELGLALGGKNRTRKRGAGRLLVLDREPHRYLEFLSDLRGCDPVAHHNDRHAAIVQVRHWLSSYHKEPLNGPNHMKAWFDQFLNDLPDICSEWGIDRKDMSFNDLVYSIRSWTEANILTAQAVRHGLARTRRRTPTNPINMRSAIHP